MRKKVLGKKGRELCLFLERLLAVTLAVSLSFIFVKSFFAVATHQGEFYHYTLNPLEQNREFENSEVFHDLVYEHMEAITRLAVIRHQLENNGSYDTRKKIDISAYANRQEGVKQELPTAYFYLDDLVKWGNYGFTYNTVIGTWEELNRLFEGNEVVYTGSENLTGAASVSDNSLAAGEPKAEDQQYEMDVLVPRYKTTEGKDLMECASEVEEYEKLKQNLIFSATDLFKNYTEYVKVQELYKSENTNMGYCIRIDGEDGPIYYSNSDTRFEGKTADEITASIRQMGEKFLTYNPDLVQINTNMEFSAAQMRDLLKEYDYTFRDNTRVWFWVDTQYPIVDDFSQAWELMEGSYPLVWTMAAVSITVLGLWILVLVFLTAKEGRVLIEDEIIWKLKKQDRIYLEVWAVPVVLIAGILLYLSARLLLGYKVGTITYGWIPAAIGLFAFIVNEVLIRFYLSLVRRIKAKSVWKTTFLYKAIIKGKELILQAYSNGGIVTRTWIPYLIFLLVNLILVLLGIGGVAGAFLLDILVGIYLYRENRTRETILEGIELIRDGKVKHRIDTTHLHGENLRLADSVNRIGTGIHKAVETSMKDEKLKTDLITNVSHDIKTPLTSIITYVDLLKRENISDTKIVSYLDVLDNKSQRLKQLIDDLVEASKISSGNINLQIEAIDFVELTRQALGEFDEVFSKRKLQIVTRFIQSPAMIEADSSQLWRVLENLFQNVSKYALEGTRVYIEMEECEEGRGRKIQFMMKNISAGLLDIQAGDLTERFIRGDASRQTEGSGLGLSIAKNLIEVQDGEFEVQVDGDLFKVIIRFWKLDE